MNIKIKEITFNIGGDPVSDTELTLAEYTSRLLSHFERKHNIKLLESNRVYVRGLYTEYMYIPVVKRK